MIMIFTCHCYGAEAKARRVLRDVNVSNYMGVPVYTGKRPGTMYLESLPEELQTSPEVASLKNYINTQGSYSVIAGMDESHFRWTDVHKAGIVEMADAQAIVGAFA